MPKCSLSDDVSALGFPPEDQKEGEERIPLSIDIWPGDYVLLTQEDWKKARDLIKEWVPERVRKATEAPMVQEFTIPDSGPRICPHCGMDHWMHRGRCRKMYADPNDPDAEY